MLNTPNINDNDVDHPDLADQRVEDDGKRPSDYADDPPKKFWKDTRIGRFLSLRTKTSKAIVGILAGAGSTLLPPPIGNIINGTIQLLIPNPSTMEVLTDMSLLQVAITIAAFLVLTGVPLLFKGVRDSAIWKAVEGRIDDVADAFVEAVDKESDGGKKITRDEVKQIIKEAIKPDA